MVSRSTTLVLGILISAALFVVISCTGEQAVTRTSLFEQYYIIEPTNLMESLKNESPDDFMPTSEQPDFLPVDQQLAVNWLQADYFYIATVLYERVLGKSLQGWQLHDMDFRASCENIDEGFQNGRLDFLNVINENDVQVLNSRLIDIDTRGNFIYVKEWKYSPNSGNSIAIDLNGLKVSAEQAFQIAERNGGREKRQSVHNACEITIGLSPGSANYRGWLVTYTRVDTGDFLFRIQIDPVTGKIYYP
jgi:hypothetical protein